MSDTEAIIKIKKKKMELCVSCQRMNIKIRVAPILLHMYRFSHSLIHFSVDSNCCGALPI